MFLESGPLSKRFRYPPLHVARSRLFYLSDGWHEVDAIPRESPRAAPRRSSWNTLTFPCFALFFSIAREVPSRARFEETFLLTIFSLHLRDGWFFSFHFSLALADWTFFERFEVLPRSSEIDNRTFQRLAEDVYVFVLLEGIFFSFWIQIFTKISSLSNSIIHPGFLMWFKIFEEILDSNESSFAKVT